MASSLLIGPNAISTLVRDMTASRIAARVELRRNMTRASVRDVFRAASTRGRWTFS